MGDLRAFSGFPEKAGLLLRFGISKVRVVPRQRKRQCCTAPRGLNDLRVFGRGEFAENIRGKHGQKHGRKTQTKNRGQIYASGRIALKQTTY